MAATATINQTSTSLRSRSGRPFNLNTSDLLPTPFSVGFDSISFTVSKFDWQIRLVQTGSCSHQISLFQKALVNRFFLGNTTYELKLVIYLTLASTIRLNTRRHVLMFPLCWWRRFDAGKSDKFSSRECRIDNRIYERIWYRQSWKETSRSAEFVTPIFTEISKRPISTSFCLSEWQCFLLRFAVLNRLFTCKTIAHDSSSTCLRSP